MHAFDRRTDRRTDRIIIAWPRLHSMQHGKYYVKTLSSTARLAWELRTAIKRRQNIKSLDVVDWTGGRGEGKYRNEQTPVWSDVIVILSCCVCVSDIPFPLMDLVYKARADVRADCHPQSFAFIDVSSTDQLTISRAAVLTVPVRWRSVAMFLNISLTLWTLYDVDTGCDHLFTGLSGSSSRRGVCGREGWGDLGNMPRIARVLASFSQQSDEKVLLSTF